MLKPRIAVLVSGGGTNLAALLKAQSDGILKSGEIVLVISSKPGARAIERAREANIPCAAADRAQYPSREAFEAELLRLLFKNRIDLIVLAGFLQILSADFVARYPDRILNVHPSLLPAYCGKGFYGRKVHEAVLAAGERTTGATVHMVNEIPDGGRILMQKAVPVLMGDTPDTLQKRVMEEAEWKLLPAAAELICARLLREWNEGEES
ncbi:MAG TPA: phosphoribosylglycinamide formyltransferase [Clostridia bacterium]|nr:phosphoribosylglycinamide formyltransferase [Clostridia bacterium]